MLFSILQNVHINNEKETSHHVAAQFVKLYFGFDLQPVFWVLQAWYMGRKVNRSI